MKPARIWSVRAKVIRGESGNHYEHTILVEAANVTEAIKNSQWPMHMEMARIAGRANVRWEIEEVSFSNDVFVEGGAK